jgi:enoyl-CoA hydratase
MDYQDIRFTKNDSSGTIMIDRPDAMNAMRFQTMVELEDAVTAAGQDENIRVLVITGAGKWFVSGADIPEMAAEENAQRIMSEVIRGRNILSALENFSKPVIARINGAAMGGGLELALCCDVRIASSRAILALPEIKLGIIPGYGGTQRLPRLIGPGKAKELILTGDFISAKEALTIGLVNEVVPMEQLDDAVNRLAAKLADKSPLALRLAKVAVNTGLQADLNAGLEIESYCFARCFDSDDRKEGLNAFLEKRRPVFRCR